VLAAFGAARAVAKRRRGRRAELRRHPATTTRLIFRPFHSLHLAPTEDRPEPAPSRKRSTHRRTLHDRSGWRGKPPWQELPLGRLPGLRAAL